MTGEPWANVGRQRCRCICVRRMDRVELGPVRPGRLKIVSQVDKIVSAE